MENYLNITQLAGLRNATTETLRHYDRIGLLKPAYVDPGTGYRYYSTEQVEIFDTIMDLRDMGLPLKEIQEFMDHRNVENSYEILSKKADELRQEIAEKQKMLLQIEQKTTYINMVKNEKLFSLKQWRITHIGKRSMVISRAKEKDLSDFICEFTRLRKNLSDDFNVFGTNISGSLIDPGSFLHTGKERLLRYPALPYGICEEEIRYGELTELPEADYLVCFGKGVLTAESSELTKIRRYLSKNGYEVTGYLYERDIIDISLTNDPAEVIYRLEIPVRKASGKEN